MNHFTIQKSLICLPVIIKNGYKIIFLLTGVFLILTLSACGTSPIGRYNPSPSLAQGAVNKVAFSNSIAIINDQPATDDHHIRFRKTIVNYNTFTQSIVDALKMELKRNSVPVDDSSEKKLYIKVTNVNFQLRSPSYRGYIDVEVKIGKDHTEFIEATRASYASPFNLDTAPTKPLDAAFKDIVRDILNNKKIQEYIMN